MLCTMYLYFFVQVSTVNHEWNDDFCAYGRPMGHLFFLLFSYVIFLILCKLILLYFTLYGIHVHIHIFVHTMEACNKDYYYYYYYYYTCKYTDLLWGWYPVAKCISENAINQYSNGQESKNTKTKHQSRCVSSLLGAPKSPNLGDLPLV